MIFGCVNKRYPFQIKKAFFTGLYILFFLGLLSKKIGYSQSKNPFVIDVPKSKGKILFLLGKKYLSSNWKITTL